MTPSSTTELLARGLRKRCGVCARGDLFRRWFTMLDECPQCGLRFERIDGHWLGAITLNMFVSLASLIVAIVVGFVATSPDPRVGIIVSACVGLALVVPLAFYPTSKTLWTAIDLRMRPLEPGEVKPGFWE